MRSDVSGAAYRVYDLNTDLPELQSAEEGMLLDQMDQMSSRIREFLNQGGQLEGADLHEVLNLIPTVLPCPRAAAVLGHIFYMLKEYPAMRDLYRQLIAEHGALPPFLYFQAQAEEGLGNLQTALDLYMKIIGQGERNFWIYYHTARVQARLSKYRESISMANLALYENKEELIEPFVLLAENFHAIGELPKMFECFSRIEKMRGLKTLESIGPIYRAHRQMYENLKKHVMKEE